jgi:hypothetical protein
MVVPGSNGKASNFLTIQAMPIVINFAVAQVAVANGKRGWRKAAPKTESGTILFV